MYKYSDFKNTKVNIVIFKLSQSYLFKKKNQILQIINFLTNDKMSNVLFICMCIYLLHISLCALSISNIHFLRRAIVQYRTHSIQSLFLVRGGIE